MKNKNAMLALAALAFLLIACKGQVKDNAQTAEAPPAAMPDNSRTALDWAGVYKGTLPCADCEGVEMTLALNQDLSYTLQADHIGKGAPASQRRGTFAWDEAGRNITLSGLADVPNRFLVGEERLFQLDPAGQRITGAQAERYILHKQAEAPEASLAGTRWRLTEIMGQPVAPPAAGQREAFIMLQADDSRFHGSGGCNNLAGAFELQEGSRISFTQIASTKMACPDMSVETELLRALEMADNYHLSPGTLVLNRARMAPLARFAAE